MALKRLVIIGAGAVGGCIGSLLAEAGYPVCLVARGDHGRQIRETGLRLRMPERTTLIKLNCVEQIEQVEWQHGDMAMIATKLQDAKPAMDQLLKVAGSHLPMVCATNGIHGERWATERFETVLAMLVWLSATHLEPGEVRSYASQGVGGNQYHGVLDVGLCKRSEPADDAANQLGITLCQWLGDAGFDSVVRDDIQSWKHAKWITNLGNAAQALVTDDWKTVARAAQSEGEQVLETAGIERVSTQKLLDRCKHVSSNPIDGQKRQGGSTWQSLQRGKPLETAWIEGAMADLAEQHGLSAPINRYLAEAAKSPRSLLANEVLAVQ